MHLCEYFVFAMCNALSVSIHLHGLSTCLYANDALDFSAFTRYPCVCVVHHEQRLFLQRRLLPPFNRT